MVLEHRCVSSSLCLYATLSPVFMVGLGTVSFSRYSIWLVGVALAGADVGRTRSTENL